MREGGREGNTDTRNAGCVRVNEKDEQKKGEGNGEESRRVLLLSFV